MEHNPNLLNYLLFELHVSSINQAAEKNKKAFRKNYFQRQ